MGTFCDFAFRGIDLDAKDFPSRKSDPYFVICIPTANCRHAKGSDGSPKFQFIESDMGEHIFDVVCEAGSAAEAAASLAIDAVTALPGKLLNLGLSIITFSARALINYSTKTHTVPNGYHSVYESEVISSNLNPTWDPIRIDFYRLCKGNFDTELLIQCYDWDRFKPSDYIGSFQVPLRTLLEQGHVERSYELRNEKGKRSGELAIRTMTSVPKILFFDFISRGQGLTEKGRHGSTDPYLVVKAPVDIHEHDNPFESKPIKLEEMPLKYGIQKHSSTKGYREIYESEYREKTVGPKWNPFRISYYDLCRAKPNVELLIECYDRNDVRKNEIIGSGTVSVQALMESKGSLIDVQLLSKDKKKTRGIIQIATRYVECSFQDNSLSTHNSPFAISPTTKGSSITLSTSSSSVASSSSSSSLSIGWRRGTAQSPRV